VKSANEQLEILQVGTERIVTVDELKQKLTENRPLTVKLGVDPTAPDLTLGHTVVMRKLRQFQDLGHNAVLIIGDFTAQIGDPSGRNTARPPLSPVEIERNAQTYQQQAFKILDKNRTKIVRNSEWFGKMSVAELLKLAARATVARTLERDDFTLRYKSGSPIGVHELLYPLLQGWDSVMIKADVEIGGTDQLFNMLVGRDLQRDEGQPQQIVLTVPLLEGTDGVQKMSKSLGNYVGITEPPKEIYGKTMSISDELMTRWYTLLLGRKPEGHPMQAKKDLARALVEQFHGKSAAEKAAREFDAQFSQKNLAEVAEPLKIVGKKSVKLLDLLNETGKFSSKSQLRRLFSQGGISLDGTKITDPNAEIPAKNGAIIRAGKRLVFRLQS
jgi:tyrosyl-tRNA synthetase